MTDSDLIMGEVLDYPDKCDQVDADGRIIHSPFCGLSEKLAKGERIFGVYMELHIPMEIVDGH
jgi:hypothetical protein